MAPPIAVGQSILSQRPYSIRTRIKTRGAVCEYEHVRVRDHIPLEQGLRPSQAYLSARASDVRDHIPLEQGLRPLLVIIFRIGYDGQRPYSIRTRIKTQRRH